MINRDNRKLTLLDEVGKFTVSTLRPFDHPQTWETDMDDRTRTAAGIAHDLQGLKYDEKRLAEIAAAQEASSRVLALLLAAAACVLAVVSAEVAASAADCAALA